MTLGFHNLKKLDLSTLHLVKDGRVARMVAKQLNRMVADLETAPDIPDWRTATLEIRAKPITEVVNGRHELIDVEVEFKVPGVKVPHRATSLRMRPGSDTNGARQLMFNCDADHPDQRTLLPPAEEIAAPHEVERAEKQQEEDDGDDWGGEPREDDGLDDYVQE